MDLQNKASVRLGQLRGAVRAKMPEGDRLGLFARMAMGRARLRRYAALRKALGLALWPAAVE